MEDAEIMQIARFQKYLSSLRKVAGWSAEGFAERLGVTRQTIINLESRTTQMTKIQYLAIRVVIITEVDRSKNETLGRLLSLVDRSEMEEADDNRLIQSIDEAASSVSRRAGSKAASKAIEKSDTLMRSLSDFTVGFVAATAAAAAAVALSLFWGKDDK